MVFETNVPITLGTKIRVLRTLRGLKQIDLARKAGLDRRYLCNIENGKRNGLGLKTVRKIATALDVSLGELFKGVE